MNLKLLIILLCINHCIGFSTQGDLSQLNDEQRSEPLHTTTSVIEEINAIELDVIESVRSHESLYIFDETIHPISPRNLPKRIAMASTICLLNLAFNAAGPILVELSQDSPKMALHTMVWSVLALINVVNPTDFFLNMHYDDKVSKLLVFKKGLQFCLALGTLYYTSHRYSNPLTTGDLRTQMHDNVSVVTALSLLDFTTIAILSWLAMLKRQ